MDAQLRDRMVVVGASALGATVVLGGAFWLLESASRRDALKLRVVASFDPVDRDLLSSLVKEAHIVSSELSASLDRITERGIDLNFRALGGKKKPS
jgi:hypothetical protein